MWWILYILLFGAATLLAIGAFTGVGRGFTSLLGSIAWFIVGNASLAVEYYDGTGTQHVAQSVPLSWLAYAVAVVHLVVLLITVYDLLTDEDAGVDSPDELAEQIDVGEMMSDEEADRILRGDDVR